MTKIAPGGDNISDAPQQTAQRIVAQGKEQKVSRETPANPTGGASVARISFADKKFHIPETPADYEKRVREDRELRGVLGDKD